MHEDFEKTCHEIGKEIWNKIKPIFTESLDGKSSGICGYVIQQICSHLLAECISIINNQEPKILEERIERLGKNVMLDAIVIFNITQQKDLKTIVEKYAK
jgi:hypothetical protein